MTIHKTNIEEKLANLKSKSSSNTDIIDLVYALFEQDELNENRISESLEQPKTLLENDFDFEALETECKKVEDLSEEDQETILAKCNDIITGVIELDQAA